MKEQSYIVIECFVDLNDIMRGVRHSYSESDTLIKYSKKQDSPVSSVPSDSIRLGAAGSYRDYMKNPGLVGDDTEGEYTEIHDWTKRGSMWERARRKSLIEHSTFLSTINLKNIKFEMSITWKLASVAWLYCTSIDPKVNGQRIIQMKRTDPEYNFMTKIDEPTTFAQQLGYDFRRQIESKRDLKCESQGQHMLASTENRQSGRCDYSIFVSHGPVVYLHDKENAEFINRASEKMGNRFVLFVKDKKYEVQQEYRFVVSVNFHSPSEKAIFLKVSEDLKRFMSPLSFR